MPSGTIEKFNPDWLGIAQTFGPYQDTFDILCYKRDGQLLTWTQFDTLGAALDYGSYAYGIAQAEWQACQIEITDEKGHVVWGDMVPLNQPGDQH